MGIVLTERVEELAEYGDAWDDLSRCASDPNPFFERWMLLPALEHLRGSSKVVVALVTDDREGTLIGLVPLVTLRQYRGMPLPHSAVWKHVHCFLGTPLLRRGRETTALEALLSCDGLEGAATALLSIEGDGVTANTLRSLLRQRSYAFDLIDTYQRPMFEAPADLETYLLQSVQARHLRDLEKRRAKLASQGELSVEVQWDDADVERWCAEFCQVESSGWKGAEGSAVASNVAERRYFEQAVCAGAAKGSLLRLAIRLDGRPIAITCLALAAETAFAWKIAYDEEFSRWSPGVLLVIEVMRAVVANPHRVVRIDSCATPDHPVLTRFWQERRTIASWGVSRPTWSSRVAVSALAHAAKMKRTWQRLEPDLSADTADAPDSSGL